MPAASWATERFEILNLAFMAFSLDFAGLGEYERSLRPCWVNPIPPTSENGYRWSRFTVHRNSTASTFCSPVAKCGKSENRLPKMMISREALRLPPGSPTHGGRRYSISTHD